MTNDRTMYRNLLTLVAAGSMLALSRFMALPTAAASTVDIAEAPPHVDLSRHEGYYSVMRRQPVLSALRNASRSTVPARPLARMTQVSDVLVSLSTESMLN